ncbi:MAG TPA: hypothetical protein VGC09_10170 [Rhodopila sp.]
MSALQPDLFSASPAPPRRPMAVQPQPARPPADEPFPVPPTLDWAKRLTAAGRIAGDVTFHISWLWAGEVTEALCLGSAGRVLLHKDGRIEEIKPDPGAFGRMIFLDPTRARELHARRPLIRFGNAGTHSARYRLAQPGEAAPTELELPPSCDSD